MSMYLRIFITTLVLLSSGLSGGVSLTAHSQEACMQAPLRLQIQQQNEHYLTMGGLAVPPERQSVFIPGTTSRVVVMFHGFLASPEQMLPLANHLHQQTGDAMYAPLIFGFGDN